MWSFKATVYGQLQSKSNGRRLSFRGGKPRSIKSKVALAWWESAILQLKAIHAHQEPFCGPICLTARVFYPSKRNDLDVSLLMDVLQVGTPKNPGVGIIKNDRQIVKQILVRETDKDSPRVEFWLDEYICEKAVDKC